MTHQIKQSCLFAIETIETRDRDLGITRSSIGEEQQSLLFSGHAKQISLLVKPTSVQERQLDAQW